MNLKPRSRSAQALERIRALLDARAGHTEWRLPPERDLVAETGTGRRAVRCALEQLEVEGRVWRHQGKGTFAGRRSDVRPQLVASIAEWTNPLEVMEARLEIEPGLARLTAAKATAEGIETLQRILRRLNASDDAEAMELWDGAFHRFIAETADNRLLLTIFDVIDRIRLSPTWRQPRAQARSADRLRVTQAQHAALIDAIARHDGAEAERAMRQHLLTLQSNLRHAMLGLAPDAEPSLDAGADTGAHPRLGRIDAVRMASADPLPSHP